MKYTKNGFTLIELMISITIFFIIVMMSYANYAYYSNIMRVKLSLKEISQSINEARNLAIAGFDKNGINQSIGVYFNQEMNKNVIQFYSFDYNSGITVDTAHLLKERKLQDNVGIEKLGSGSISKKQVMIYFSSIYAQPDMYYDGNYTNTGSETELDFVLSFRGAKNFPLKRELKYFKDTNVVDY